MHACWAGQDEILQILLASKFKDVLKIKDTSHGSNGFILACQKGNENIVRFIVGDPDSKKFLNLKGNMIF